MPPRAGAGRTLDRERDSPEFVRSLSERGLLRRSAGGSLSMPGSDGLRLPVMRRSLREYLAVFQDAGFKCRTEDIYATPEVLSVKPGLKEVRNVPIALLLEASKGSPLPPDVVGITRQE
jgi:hypothetical protein